MSDGDEVGEAGKDALSFDGGGGAGGGIDEATKGDGDFPDPVGGKGSSSPASVSSLFSAELGADAAVGGGCLTVVDFTKGGEGRSCDDAVTGGGDTFD